MLDLNPLYNRTRMIDTNISVMSAETRKQYVILCSHFWDNKINIANEQQKKLRLRIKKIMSSYLQYPLTLSFDEFLGICKILEYMQVGPYEFLIK